LDLLHDICRGVSEPPRKAIGRPPVPLADAIFACAFKVYSTLSSRRFMSDLADAVAKGFLSRTVSFSAINKALENPEITPILYALVAESAAPLKSIEKDFAVDSSGLATSRYVRWFDQKYGRTMKEHRWVKVHLMCGVKTNVVTAVEIGGMYSGDCPQFAPLVNRTAETFKIGEVSADKAYLSYDNMEVVDKHGGLPYIAFKAGTAANRGGTLAKMFHLYNLNRDDYLAHYHKRSNVESTFSMMKAKFGANLLSKTDAALVNETLCKVLCHNLCCLIQSACELGVIPIFWADDEQPKDSVGPESNPSLDMTDIDNLMSIYEWI
jgi:transposase